MTPEDEEFNRIEREAKQRMESVSAALDKMADNERDLGIQMRTEYERGFIDGMQKQMQSSVDKAVNRMANQPAQQEPVAWIVEDQSGERLEWASDAHSCYGVPTFPLYTSPPAQRTWVELTDAELVEFSSAKLGPYDLCLEVEARLKGKNT